MAFSGGWSVGEGVSASMLPGLARDGLALTSGGAKRGAGAVRRGRGLEEKIVIGRVCVRSWVAFGAGWSVAVRRSAADGQSMETSGELIVDVGNAWGLDNAFKMVARHLRPDMRRSALDRYRTLAQCRSPA